MAQRHSAGSQVRPGWQQPQLAVPLAVLLVAAGIGVVVLLTGAARHAGSPTNPSAASSNSTDRAYVLAMLWHQEQAQELASLVQGRTSRPELRRLALSIRTTQTGDAARMTAWLRARDPTAGNYLVQSDAQPADRWFAGMMASSQVRTLAATAGSRFDFSSSTCCSSTTRARSSWPTGYSRTAATQKSHCSPAGRLLAPNGRSSS